MKTALRDTVRTLLRPIHLVPLALLSYWVASAYGYLRPALFRTWFFSSDEYVIAAEVIRFSNLDFRQRFFDLPGTPFMLLDSLLWALVYGVERVLGLAPSTTLATFTFQHISALFVLMRATTLLCFLLSAVLLYALVAKLMNSAAAAIASLLLVMSPIYCSYSSFTRTDSLAMVLILLATIWLLRGLEQVPRDSAHPPTIRDHVFIAGILLGVAAGARLHSLAAGLPPLLMLLWLERRPAKGDYPAWVLKWSKWTLPPAWVAALFLCWMAKARLAAAPGAQSFVVTLALGGLLMSGAALLLYRARATRALVVRVLSPDAIKLLLGCCVGGVLSNPTALWQYNYFLGSVQMYSRYRDWDRMQWPFLKNAAWYLRHYVQVIAPDGITVALFCVGATLILIARDRKVIPFLIGAVLFFFSKPLTLVAAPHHAILWLPFVFIVCAYPLAKLVDCIPKHTISGEASAVAILGAMVLACLLSLTSGPQLARAAVFATENRLQNVGRATAWIKQNTPPQGPVAMSYFCFNPGTFYTWLRALEVPVPPSVFDGREYLIWWGHRSALRGKTGYACATPSDVISMKTNLDLSSPGEGTDPYSDPRFERVATFGSGPDEVDLFHFDQR
jgi:hypothetical protein